MMFLILVALIPLCIRGQLRTPEEDATKLFLEFDTNGDKVLQMSETIFYFDRMDLDADGRVSRHEFGLHWEVSFPHLSAHALHVLFDVFDVSQDHHVDLSDFVNFYPEMNYDDDVAVTEEEFIRYWTVKFTEAELHR